MDGDAVLAGLIDRVRAFGAQGLDLAAKEATPLVQAEARRTAAAGTDPYGELWRPRKDGSRAIPDAASVVSVVARGPVLVIRITGGAAIQNFLSSANRRQVIPDPYRPLPDGMAKALQDGATRAFRKLVG